MINWALLGVHIPPIDSIDDTLIIVTTLYRLTTLTFVFLPHLNELGPEHWIGGKADLLATSLPLAAGSLNDSLAGVAQRCSVVEHADWGHLLQSRPSMKFRNVFKSQLLLLLRGILLVELGYQFPTDAAPSFPARSGYSKILWALLQICLVGGLICVTNK